MRVVGIIVKAVVLIVFLLLAISNTARVDFFYLPGQGMQLPLIVVLFGTFILGILFGMFALFGRLLSLRSENNRLRSEVKKNTRITAEPVPAVPAKPSVQTALQPAGKPEGKE